MATNEPTRITEISGEDQLELAAGFRKIEHDARRAENMAGIDEGRAQAGEQLERLVVAGGPLELIQTIPGVRHRIQRLRARLVDALPTGAPRLMFGVFCLQMRGIQHDQASELAGRAGRDDLAAEPALGEERQAPAMIEMRVGQQHHVDRRRMECCPEPPPHSLSFLVGRLGSFAANRLRGSHWL